MGLLSDLGSSIRNVFFGFALVLLAVPVLFWNERSSVRIATSLDEGAGAVTSIEAGAALPANDGKLVHITGDAKADAPLKDPTLGIETRALTLHRDVEMYQWREYTKGRGSSSNANTVGKYRYEQVWADQIVQSKHFKSRGYTNPTTMPYKDGTTQAGEVRVEAFRLGDDLTAKLQPSEDLPLQGLAPEGFTIHDGMLYKSANPAEPAIGDIRISLTYAPEGPISVVGKQAGDTLVAFMSSAGDPIALVETGTKAAEEMFEHAQEANTVATWLTRVIGFLMIFGGFMLGLGPFRVVADRVPLIGGLITSALAFVSFLLALVVAGVLTGIAWIAAHPLLGIGLLAVAAIAGGVLFTASKKG